MLEAIIIILGLSLDGFVSMMQTGATLKDLTWKKRFIYTGVYAVVGVVSAMVGFGITTLAKELLAETHEMVTAAMIIFCLGIKLMTKSYKFHGYEEKLDKYFNVKKLLRMAIITNIDTLALAAGFSFLDLYLIPVVLAIGIVSFILVVTALTVGYNLGASYQRTIGTVGGALMVVFSIWIFMKYVFRV